MPFLRLCRGNAGRCAQALKAAHLTHHMGLVAECLECMRHKRQCHRQAGRLVHAKQAMLASGVD